MRSRLAVVLVVCLLQVSCGLDTEQYVDFKVSGMVLDASTNKGIDNIRVDVRSKNIGVFARLVTEKGGVFDIKGMNGGYDLGDSICVIARDVIDTIQNGWYESDSVWVPLVKDAEGRLNNFTTSKAENIRLFLKNQKKE